MASVRAVLFVAVCAVAAQYVSALGWDFKITGPFGSSGSLSSTGSSRTTGVGVNIEDGALNGKIEVGPLGGIQSRIVAPVLPSITSIGKNIQDEVQKMANSVGAFFDGVINTGLDMFGLPKIDLWTKIVSAHNFVINGIRTNVMGLINRAGGILGATVKAGLVSAQEASAVAASFMRSALANMVNPLAKVIDVVQWAVDSKLIMEKTAVQLIALAIKQGLHTVEGATDTAANAFWDAAVRAQTINKDVAEKLKAAMTGRANAAVGADATNDVNGAANVNAGANFKIGADTSAATNTGASVRASATNKADADLTF